MRKGLFQLTDTVHQGVDRDEDVVCGCRCDKAKDTDVDTNEDEPMEVSYISSWNLASHLTSHHGPPLAFLPLAVFSTHPLQFPL